MIGVFYGRNLTEERSCHEKENRNAIVEIKRELNQFTIYYSVIVTLNDRKLAQITKLFLLNYKFAGKSAGNSARFDLVFAGFLTAFGPFATDVKLPATATWCNDGAPAEPAFAAAGEAVDE